MTKVRIDIDDGIQADGTAGVSFKMHVDRGNRLKGLPPTDSETVGIMMSRMWESSALMALLPLVCMDIMALRDRHAQAVAQAAKGTPVAPAGTQPGVQPAGAGGGLVLPPHVLAKMQEAQRVVEADKRRQMALTEQQAAGSGDQPAFIKSEAGLGTGQVEDVEPVPPPAAS